MEIGITATERLKQCNKIDLLQYHAISSPLESLQTNLILTRKDWCATNRALCRLGSTKQNLNMWRMI